MTGLSNCIYIYIPAFTSHFCACSSAFMELNMLQYTFHTVSVLSMPFRKKVSNMKQNMKFIRVFRKCCS